MYYVVDYAEVKLWIIETVYLVKLCINYQLLAMTHFYLDIDSKVIRRKLLFPNKKSKENFSLISDLFYNELLDRIRLFQMSKK